MKYILLFVSILYLAHPGQGQAAFYQWLDAQGVTHFTDNPERIPAKYRSHVKELQLADEPAQAPAPQTQAPAQVAAPRPVPHAVEYGGHGEGWWRSRYASLRQELKGLEDGLAGKQARLSELRRKRVVYMRAQDREAVNSMQAEISTGELRISELQKDLADLERRATEAGVPSEWRQ